jgi:hypothetical protein
MEIVVRFFYVLILLSCCFPIFAGPKFLILTDIHYGVGNKEAEGQDTGPAFLNSTLKQMAQLTKNVDFILNLGDLPTHMPFFTSKKGEYEHTLFQELYKADASLKPLFYIAGNNDSLGGNYQPFSVDGQSPLSYADHWDGACLNCSDLIIDKTHMDHDGYYSSYVMPNNKEVILLALNSAPFVNVPLLASKYPNQEADAKAELLWFEHQLKHHSAKQLLIAMHVPPGTTYKGGQFWNEQPLQRFIFLLDTYAARYGQITLLTGHTHMDELRKLPLSKGSIYNYSTPAISRIHYNNPGMKVFSLNDAMTVANYTTYYTTNLKTWSNEHYDALGSTDAVFPQCHTLTLAQCLDSLSDQQVCHNLEGGLFYGAKSDRVPKNVCHTTYVIKTKAD